MTPEQRGLVTSVSEGIGAARQVSLALVRAGLSDSLKKSRIRGARLVLLHRAIPDIETLALVLRRVRQGILDIDQLPSRDSEISEFVTYVLPFVE